MEAEAHDQEIIRLLAKVKEADPDYPQRLLATRREQYLRQIGYINLGISGESSTSPAGKPAKALANSTLASKLIEGTLLIAIIAEGAAVLYLSRDKLGDFFQTPTISETQPDGLMHPIVTGSPTPVLATSAPRLTATLVQPSPSEVIATPTSVLSTLDLTGAVSTTAATQGGSTPIPNGNNGNHYGQTPKPERTKENNGNDNRPPQAPRPTRQPRPTRTN